MANEVPLQQARPQALDWAGQFPIITNVAVLQKTGLSTISEILCNRRLSLFGHVIRLDPEVPA